VTTLTRKERLVLSFLTDYQAAHGCPPTVREIGEGCGIPSTRSVSDYLKGLERAGLIRRRGHRSRGIELVDRPDAPGVPILGRIAAGGPLAAEAHDAGRLEVDGGRLFGADGCFALEVKGDSMTGRHILPGDMAVIRPRPTAEPGDVVAVAVDGEVTLKVYQETGRGAARRIVLMPANPAYEPIVIEAKQGAEAPDVRILGVMVGLVRRGSGAA
jgi:repressor LexA